MPLEAPTRTALSAAGLCRRCGIAAEPAAQFCSGCGALQPPADVDYFRRFGLPRKLALDTARLQQEFYRRSRRLHPDLYASASAQEQQWSLEQSSQLNDAYRTLKDGVARTQYLLSLEGVRLEEQSQAATERARQTGEEKKQVVPPDLLEEVFELNLQLQELKASGGRDEAARAQLAQAGENFKARMAALETEMHGLWQAWDAEIDAEIDAEMDAELGAENDAEMDAKTGARRDGATSPPASPPQRARIRDRMVDVLNRRSYIRNLLRDVNEALEQ